MNDHERIDMHVEKELSRRIGVFLRDPELISIANRFGGDVFRRSSALYGLSEFLNGKVKANVCVEIGSWNGITAQILSRYCDSVVSIDIVDNPLKYQIDDHVSSYRKRSVSNVRFVTVNPDQVGDVISLLDFDFAFMDGDHARETVSNWEAVRRCGHVLFHEAWPSQPPVWALLQSLPKDEVELGAFNFALWKKKNTRRENNEREV